MATNTQLTTAAENSSEELRRVCASGERSTMGRWLNLLNGTGGILKPGAFYVGELAIRVAGHLGFDLYAAGRCDRTGGPNAVGRAVRRIDRPAHWRDFRGGGLVVLLLLWLR